MKKPFQSATDAAVRYVARRERTEAEVRDKLKEYGFSDAQIDEAVLDLRNSLLLNDGEYAREFVRTKLVTPHSIKALRQKMRAHKLSEEVIDDALSDLDTDFENAYSESFSFLHNAMRGEYDMQKLKQKLYRRLISHGYSYDTARAAMEKAEEGLGTGSGATQAP